MSTKTSTATGTTKGAAVDDVTLRELQHGVHVDRSPRGAYARVLAAVEAGFLVPTEPLRVALEQHRAALRALQLQRAQEGGTALPAADAALWAQVEAGHDVSLDDLDGLRRAAAADAVEVAVRGVVDEWAFRSSERVKYALERSVNRMIETGVAPWLERIDRQWQPMVADLAGRDPRDAALFVGVGDDAGRAALRGAEVIADLLAQARAAFRDLAEVVLDPLTVGKLEDAGAFDRPSGGPVDGGPLDKLVTCGVQPQWCPRVQELRDAIAGRSQVLESGEVERRRTELAKREAVREAQQVAAARLQAEQRSRDLAAAADRAPVVPA